MLLASILFSLLASENSSFIEIKEVKKNRFFPIGAKAADAAEYAGAAAGMIPSADICKITDVSDIAAHRRV